MSYKKYKWEIIANDFNSPFIRNIIFTQAFFKYKKLLGLSRPVIGIVSKKNIIEYVFDIKLWGHVHEEMKAKTDKNYKYVSNLIKQMEAHCQAVNKWTEKNIFKQDLSKISDKKIIDLLNQFIDRQSTAYAYGVALVILDFHDFSYVEGNLENFLKSRVKADEYQKYYQVFTYPPRNSFAQDQEEALLSLMGKFYRDKRWVKDVLSKDLSFLSNSYPEFLRALKKHTKKYGWAYYVYMGPAFNEDNFLEFIRDYLNKDKDPNKILENIKRENNNIKRQKNELMKKLNPGKFYREILNLAGTVVWAKPRRKDYQSKSYYHLEKLQKEIGKRLGLSLNQVRSAPLEILEKALMKKETDIDMINSIYNHHAVLPNDDGTILLLTGKEAEKFSKLVKRPREEINTNIKEFSGTTAFGGKAKGIVKIVNFPDDMKKMEYGNILVSTATTPSIVPAMKKAAAIITDEGGLTCHASIVSRELKIPCVVGTKFATKVLKDGDRVEVDAMKGVIKKM